MNGTNIFLDTNICIYLLDGDMVLAEVLQDQSIFISVITEMELYAYHGNNPVSLKILDNFVDSVYIIDIDNAVKRNAIEIRRNTSLNFLTVL